jgi:hypothetical protein
MISMWWVLNKVQEPHGIIDSYFPQALLIYLVKAAEIKVLETHSSFTGANAIDSFILFSLSGHFTATA